MWGGPFLREGAIYRQNAFSNFNLYQSNAFKKWKLSSKLNKKIVYETAYCTSIISWILCVEYIGVLLVLHWQAQYLAWSIIFHKIFSVVIVFSCVVLSSILQCVPSILVYCQFCMDWALYFYICIVICCIVYYHVFVLSCIVFLLSCNVCRVYWCIVSFA